MPNLNTKLIGLNTYTEHVVYCLGILMTKVESADMYLMVAICQSIYTYTGHQSDLRTRSKPKVTGYRI